MTDLMVVDFARRAMLMALALGGPLLLVALVVGLLISVVQAVTQVQEQTLAFVPKLVAVGLVFLVGLPWMIQMAVTYTTELFRTLPGLAA